MNKTQIYKLGKIKQLIDLNGDTTNFDLTFNVTSNDGAEFEALVVDQNTLDSNQNLEYKKAPGTISGNIVANKNIYQNYFLLLKAENPCECTVKIDKKLIPADPKFIKEQYQSQPEQPQAQQAQKENPPKSSKFDMKKLFIIVAIVGGLAFVYFKFIKKSSNKDKTKDQDSGVKEDVDDLLSLQSTHTPKASVPNTPIKKTCDKDVCTLPPTLEIPKISSPVRTPPSLLSKLKTLPTIKKT